MVILMYELNYKYDEDDKDDEDDEDSVNDE